MVADPHLVGATAPTPPVESRPAQVEAAGEQRMGRLVPVWAVGKAPAGPVLQRPGEIAPEPVVSERAVKQPEVSVPGAAGRAEQRWRRTALSAPRTASAQATCADP